LLKVSSEATYLPLRHVSNELTEALVMD